MSDPKKTMSSGCFPTTQWTQIIGVIQNGSDGAAWNALSEFCERYRPAIHHFFRRRGCSHEEAEDHTQAFFTSRILERWAGRDGFLHTAQPNGDTKFRGFLCHVLWRFLQDEWKARTTIRAGGKISHIPLEDLDISKDCADGEASQRFGREFDRVLALEIIRKAAERSKHSKCLEAHLRGEISQKDAAKELGVSENTFKQAYSRFRERLAKELWEEVAKLVGPDEQEIRAEIKYLMSLFAESAT